VKYEADKITNLISELNVALGLLKEIRTMDFNKFQGDPHRISSAKYNLIVAIEAAIDICNHLISKNGYRVPDDYADTFRVMAEQGILHFDFVETRLVNMARFRNRLVHLYWKVNVKKLFSILQEDLSDLEEILKEIKAALKS